LVHDLDNAGDSNVFYNQSSCDRDHESDSTNTTAPLISFIPQVPIGAILVTSRDRHAAFELIGEFGDVIPVNPMDRNESLSLLKTRLRIGTQMEEEAMQLLETLDYIPLAITQACAYIEKTHL
jgi:hypothetical protein